LDTLTGLEAVWTSPFLPGPVLLFLEISSAGEFFLRNFMCDNRLLKCNKFSSFSAPSLFKISKFYVSKEIISSFVLILLTVSRPRCLFLGADTSMVDAFQVGRVDSFEGSDSFVS
jgi:hypothetical protein